MSVWNGYHTIWYYSERQIPYHVVWFWKVPYHVIWLSGGMTLIWFNDIASRLFLIGTTLEYIYSTLLLHKMVSTCQLANSVSSMQVGCSLAASPAAFHHWFHQYPFILYHVFPTNLTPLLIHTLTYWYQPKFPSLNFSPTPHLSLPCFPLNLNSLLIHNLTYLYQHKIPLITFHQHPTYLLPCSPLNLTPLLIHNLTYLYQPEIPSFSFHQHPAHLLPCSPLNFTPLLIHNWTDLYQHKIPWLTVSPTPHLSLPCSPLKVIPLLIHNLTYLYLAWAQNSVNNLFTNTLLIYKSMLQVESPF